MDRIRSDIFEKFEVRKSYKQKTAFIQWVKELCEEQGIACRVEEGGIFRSRNIVLGDAENAEVLFTAHYVVCGNLNLAAFFVKDIYKRKMESIKMMLNTCCKQYFFHLSLHNLRFILSAGKTLHCSTVFAVYTFSFNYTQNSFKYYFYIKQKA